MQQWGLVVLKDLIQCLNVPAALLSVCLWPLSGSTGHCASLRVDAEGGEHTARLFFPPTLSWYHLVKATSCSCSRVQQESNSNVAISQLSHTVKQWSQCLKWPKEVTLHIAYTMIMNQNNITDVDLHETVWKQAPHAMRVSFFLSHGYEIARPVHITVSSVDTAADIPDPRTGRLVFLYQPSHTLTCTCKQPTLWHC